MDIAEDVREMAARQVLADRKAAVAAGYPKVGLAEYIDLLTTLAELTETSRPTERSAEESAWLQRLSAYALVKNAEQPHRVTAGRGRKHPPVNRGEASAPRGATGRADHLRALAVADRDHLALDLNASSWFGYVRRAEEAPGWWRSAPSARRARPRRRHPPRLASCRCVCPSCT